MSELVEIAASFRGGLLDGRKSKNFCFMVCASLQGYLSAIGIDSDLTEGELYEKGQTFEHYWLTLSDGLILDPTADQFKTPFGKEMPPVYHGKKPKWYVIAHPPALSGVRMISKYG